MGPCSLRRSGAPVAVFASSRHPLRSTIVRVVRPTHTHVAAPLLSYEWLARRTQLRAT